MQLAASVAHISPSLDDVRNSLKRLKISPKRLQNSPKHIQKSRPGVQLLSVAWDAMLASGLTSYVDYERVLSLSQIYGIQAVYIQTSSQMIEASMNMTAFSSALGTEIDNDHYGQQFLSVFTILSAIEEQLVELYRQGLEEF